MNFASLPHLGILGQPDPEELWSEILDHIEIKPDMKFLNVAAGHGTEAKLLAKRLVASGYYTKEQAIDSIYLVDKYLQFTNPLKRMGFKRVIQEDFLKWKTDMKFDVVLGNPPYQKGDGNIGSPLWPKFIKKCVNLTVDNGITAMVTPSTWMNKSSRGAWTTLQKTDLLFVETDAKKYFPKVGGNGSTFSYFATAKRPYSGLTELSCGVDVDFHNDVLPKNTTKINLENMNFMKKYFPKVIDLEVLSGPTEPSINSKHWSNEKTDTHLYETYYSGRSDRRSIWCDTPIGHHGKWKLVVATSGNIYNSMEITRKGAGRQANYVLGDKKYLEYLKEKMLSDESIRLNEIMQEGNYNNALKYIVS